MTKSESLISIRRYLHAHPELSLEEVQTAQYIEKQLNDYGIQSRRCGKNGILALIEGKHPGPVLAFRADIDALPIQESSTQPYASQNPGVMHACGHDVHTTIGLGIAFRAFDNKDNLHGSIKLIFQPAEEASPVDTPIGAEEMVQDGALQNPRVDAAFAFHCMPTLEVGKIGFTGGPVWASSDLVEISVRGKKTHAAYPHEGIDALLVAAQLIVALQSVTSRRVDTRQPCVLSIAKLEAGNTYNVIAENAKMVGILRTLSPEAEAVAKREIKTIVENLCVAFGATGKVVFTEGARLTKNDIELERKTVSTLRKKVGSNALVNHLPQLGAEDFSAFSDRVPSCYLFLGVRNEEKGIVHMIHTSEFDVDEDCIFPAVVAMQETLFDLAQTWPEI